MIDPQAEKLIEDNVICVDINSKPLTYWYGDDSERFYWNSWEKRIKEIGNYLDELRLDVQASLDNK